MSIEFSRQAQKAYNALNEPLKSRIATVISSLPEGDVIRLKGYKTHYRLRVGDYRVIFKWVDDDMRIETIAPRDKAYGREYRL